MSYLDALAIYGAMSPEQKNAVYLIFDGIKSAFPTVYDAFSQAVIDEVAAIAIEMQLIGQEQLIATSLIKGSGQ